MKLTAPLKYKKILPQAQAPKTSEDNVGYDLFAPEDVFVKAGQRVLLRTGLAFKIPKGYWLKILDRSGMANKWGAITSAGVIDSCYTGEVKVVFYNSGDKDIYIQTGDRPAQFVILEEIKADLEETQELELTDRGDKGFGSSGK